MNKIIVNTTELYKTVSILRTLNNWAVNKVPVVITDEELFDMTEIDEELRIIDVRKPADEDIDYDFIEQMENGNREMREKLGEMIGTVRDAIERARILKDERNKYTLYPTHENKEIEMKEKELHKYNRQIKKLQMEIT